mmetsp:Transcript_26448/g.82346  ORF Transcript_26448/g.82346 Transcript_26448/m.82346 type:complete len:209 (+) Transcript_26448:901-1527(+)
MSSRVSRFMRSLTCSKMSRVAQSRDGNDGPSQSLVISSRHVLETQAKRAGAKPPEQSGNKLGRYGSGGGGSHAGCCALAASSTARAMRPTRSGDVTTASTGVMFSFAGRTARRRSNGVRVRRARPSRLANNSMRATVGRSVRGCPHRSDVHRRLPRARDSASEGRTEVFVHEPGPRPASSYVEKVVEDSRRVVVGGARGCGSAKKSHS